MKRLLIVGSNSYIGNSLASHIQNNSLPIDVSVLDVLNGVPEDFGFSSFDSVIFVAGIVHQKESKKLIPLYYKVNCDLAYEVAYRAKSSGSKHFVYLSSMSVYGVNQGQINESTTPRPKTHYGKSKLNAEIKLRSLSDSDFVLSIVRPPMVYGPSCKGNYFSLTKIASKAFVFPRIKNKRSVLNINHLSSFLSDLILEEKGGLFFPLDDLPMCTANEIVSIRKANRQNTFLSFSLALVIYCIWLFSKRVRKAFGSLEYSMGKKAIQKDGYKYYREEL